MKTFDVAPIEGVHPEFGLILAMMQDGTREWLEELWDEPPIEAIVWQPVPGGHSIGGLMLHIVNVEANWVEKSALGRERDPHELKELMALETDVDDWKWPTPPSKPWSWYLERHSVVRARTLENVKQLPSPDTTIESKKWDYAFTMRWILQHVFHHEAYHGGQIVLMKRLYDQMRTQ